jgi:hypothetical protein
LNISKEEMKKIENQVDLHLFDLLNETIPRYKYIYHINLVYIDLIIDKKLWFTTTEKHYLFSLSYNTFLAYKKLAEEDVFDYTFDKDLYQYCLIFLIKGMQYSMLCDEFPGLNSEKKSIVFDKETSTYSFIDKALFPRKHYDFFIKYNIRKALSYTLQMASGKLNDIDEEGAAIQLTKLYFNFWSENMLFKDFEPYSQRDWGGVAFFFTQASMRRFIKLYRADFNIKKLDSQKMMILISPSGKKKIIEFTLSKNQKVIDKVMEDFIYKPLGNNLFPKSNISDAPIIQTKDGYLIANPLVILFNDSNETRFLNNLRKYDNARHQRVKDKLKERAIPIIEQLLKMKYPEAKVYCNFNLPIPKKKNQTREFDILVIDDKTGFVLYIEVKHFFNPMSFSEMKSLDIQLQDAITKTSDQLYAIEYNWDLIKQRYAITTNITKIRAIILSHQYLGNDVEINEYVPIVDPQNLYGSIAETYTIEDLYNANKELDHVFRLVKMIGSNLNFHYGGYDFSIKMESLDPRFESLYLQSYRKIIMKSINFEEADYFKSIEELAKALLTKLDKNKVEE